MASNETCIQINNNVIGGRVMFYISKKVEDGRVKVVMYGRIVFMTNEEYTRWKSAMSWDKSDK